MPEKQEVVVFWQPGNTLPDVLDAALSELDATIARIEAIRKQCDSQLGVMRNLEERHERQ